MTTTLRSSSKSNTNQNNAQYKNLQNIFTNLFKTRKHFIIQTPEYPKGLYEQQSSGTTPSPASTSSSTASDVSQKIPKRICGDWSSKLKLLRYTSGSSLVGLHFVSDYSHHFGGYKAKAFMENSEYFTDVSLVYLWHLKLIFGMCLNKVNWIERVALSRHETIFASFNIKFILSLYSTQRKRFWKCLLRFFIASEWRNFRLSWNLSRISRLSHRNRWIVGSNESGQFTLSKLWKGYIIG